MMGLERLFKATFKTDPQLDMDKQFARARVKDPMTLDFAALADGIRRNNVGTAGILVEVTATVKDGWVELQPTGQRFALQGTAPEGTARGRFRVLNWEDPGKTKLESEPK